MQSALDEQAAAVLQESTAVAQKYDQELTVKDNEANARVAALEESLAAAKTEAVNLKGQVDKSGRDIGAVRGELADALISDISPHLVASS